MQNLIIFCSAPADIKYALTLREQQPQAHCRIFALQVEDMAVFLRVLRLPERTEVEFIPYPPQTIALRRIWNNIRIRRYLDRMKRKHFSQTKNCRVYFFSPYMDWVLFSFLHTLQPANHLIHVSYLPRAEEEVVRLSVNARGMLFWIRWVTRADLAYARYHTKLVSVWKGRHDLEVVSAPDYHQTVKKYAWHPSEFSANGNNILFFPGCETLTKNLRKVSLAVIRRLQTQGSRVFVKPHPRLGCPEWLLDVGLEQIPKYVPSEFLDLKCFSGVVGCESLALAEAARLGNIPCISLIDLLDYYDSFSARSYKEYVSKYSGGKVVFVENVEQVERLLSKGRDR